MNFLPTTDDAKIVLKIPKLSIAQILEGGVWNQSIEIRPGSFRVETWLKVWKQALWGPSSAERLRNWSL